METQKALQAEDGNCSFREAALPGSHSNPEGTGRGDGERPVRPEGRAIVLRRANRAAEASLGQGGGPSGTGHAVVAEGHQPVRVRVAAF